MTDTQLLADFVTSRDASAFEELVQRYGPMVLRVCREVLGDPEGAEDAFQATFVVLMRQAGSIRDHASLGRWLYEVAYRISKRERRRLWKLRTQERQAPTMDAVAPPDADPADREVRPILHDEIRRLPARLRDAIVLCYFEGLTVEVAARQLRCPVGTLKSRLIKGRELLRSRLTRRGLAASVLLLLMFSMTEEATAAVPHRLIESTVDGAISSRVARMVADEVARPGWARMVAPWGLLAAILVVFVVKGFAASGKAQAAPADTLLSSTASLGTTVPAPMPLIKADCPLSKAK